MRENLAEEIIGSGDETTRILMAATGWSAHQIVMYQMRYSLTSKFVRNSRALGVLAHTPKMRRLPLAEDGGTDPELLLLSYLMTLSPPTIRAAARKRSLHWGQPRT